MTLKNNLLFLSFLVLFEGCNTLNIRIFNKTPKNSFFNYHSKDFICHKGDGIRDMDFYDFYQKHAWDKFQKEYESQNKIKKTADIVIVGNSLIHLFSNESLVREFPNLDIVARGIGGDTTELLRKRFFSNVLYLNPKVIIIEIGGNDLIYGKCLSNIKSNTIAIIDDIQKFNKKIKIIILSVPPTLSPELNSIVPIHNLTLIQIAKDKDLTYVNLWDEMAHPDLPKIKEEYARPKDTIHFNEEGYKLIGKLIRPILNSK